MQTIANLVMGVLFFLAGISGAMVFKGSDIDASVPLMLLGGFLFLSAIYRIVSGVKGNVAENRQMNDLMVAMHREKQSREALRDATTQSIHLLRSDRPDLTQDEIVTATVLGVGPRLASELGGDAATDILEDAFAQCGLNDAWLAYAKRLREQSETE